MTPSAHEINHPSLRLIVILRIHVKETNLLDVSPSRIASQTRNVQNPKPRPVVALVRLPVHHELVVVYPPRRTAVETGLFRRGERPDVPDVGHGAALDSGADRVGFVEFVVEEEEFLPLGVGYPALVGVFLFSFLLVWGG